MSTQIATTQQTSLRARLANRYGIDQSAVMDILKATAFKQRNNEPVSNEQMAALMVVADQYRLNPFTKEIYAFPDKQNGIVPVVGVDGWSRIINTHPDFDGMEFSESDDTVEMADAKPCPAWIECAIHRKDRGHPIRVKEFLDEVYRAPFEGNGKNGKYKVAGPWQSHTKRMLRHKAMIQCARLAFGYVGIYDEDEAQRIVEARVIEHEPDPVPAMPRRKSEAKPEPAKPAIITFDQVQQLRDAMEQFGVSEEAFAEEMGGPVESLPADLFEPAMAWITPSEEAPE